METVKMTTDTLERLIRDLEDAIKVCYNADGSEEDKSYPYATGYSRAAMMSVIDTLKSLKSSEYSS
jgi:hypothetical protein